MVIRLLTCILLLKLTSPLTCILLLKLTSPLTCKSFRTVMFCETSKNPFTYVFRNMFEFADESYHAFDMYNYYNNSLYII